MKVQGANNPSFQPTAKSSQAGKPSQGKGASFESLLGGAQDREQALLERESSSGQREQQQSRQENPVFTAKQSASSPSALQVEPKRSVRTEPPRTESAEAKSPAFPNSAGAELSANPTSDNAGPDDASVNAESLPTGQSAPAFGTPGLSERAPMQATLNTAAAMNPLASQQSAPSAEDAANTLTRRVVWNDFLRKMNDLGVSAEDVLKAFGSLSEKDLAQPPEQSLDKIVAALGLQGPQAAQAKTYFGELIAKTKSKSLGEEITASHKQLSLTLASERDLQRKAQLKSIDALNNTFFMSKSMKAQAQPGQPQERTLGPDGKPMLAPLSPLTDGQSKEELAQLDDQSVMASSPLQRASEPNTMPQVQPRAAAAQDINGLVNQMQAQSQQQPSALEDKKAIEQLVKNFSAHTGKTAPEATLAAQAAAGAGAMPTAAASVSAPAAPAHASEAQNALQAILGGSRRREDSSDHDGDDQNGSQSLDSALLAGERQQPGQALKTEFQGALNEMRGPQQHTPQVMSVPDLVQQAHIMVKDGGGDMKVTLHPDGLGEVALRVSVTDGKVNVAMITESDEAKKLIERSIGDLKSGLTQNHLAVDTIKVDTATNLGKQLEQQYQDAQRQQTQAQWEQFRQDGGSAWRRSFFDTGVVNPYRSQGDTPRDAQAPATAAARAKSLASRRLDLVA